MTSKKYFTIAGVFVALYIIASLGVIVGIPEWVHQFSSITFVAATFLGLREKKKEKHIEKNE